MAQNIQSSQSFVRALKAPSDPPHPGGQSKIELAREAWDNTSFYVPNKGEVIADWLLSKLLKDKGREISSNPVSDDRYWILLSDVISASHDDQSASKLSRPSKIWLIPLLNRVPIAPIILSSLPIIPKLDLVHRISLVSAIKKCMSIIWPLAIHKITSDTILELFGEYIKAILDIGLVILTDDDAMMAMGGLINGSFKSSLANTSNKKKLYQRFMQDYLLNWAECTNSIADTSLSPSLQTLLSNIFSTGAELLFTLDILRQSQSTSLLTTLREHTRERSTVVLKTLPRLFAPYITSIRKHRGSLFGQSSGAPGASSNVTQQVKDVALEFLISCLGIIEEITDGGVNEEMKYGARLDLLEIVDREMLMTTGLRSDAEVGVTLKKIVGDATEALAPSTQGDGEVNSTRLSLKTLSTLTRIDYELVESSISNIFSKLLFISERPEAIELLDVLLDYHTKTRTVHLYITTLLASFQFHRPSTRAQAMYTTISTSPLFSFPHLDRLGKSVLNFVTPGQVADLIEICLDALDQTWNPFWQAQEKSQVDVEEKPRKKRKLLAAESNQGNHSDGLDDFGLAFSLTAQTLSTILPSLSLHTLPESTRLDIRAKLSDLLSNVWRPAMHKAFEVIQHSLQRRSVDAWSCQIATSALLSLDYTLANSQRLRLDLDRNVEDRYIMVDIVANDGILPELSVKIFRSLLNYYYDLDQDDSHKILDRLLHNLERLSSESTSWSGRSAHLTLSDVGKKEAATALLHLLINRWLPVIDLVSSQQHLERIARFIVAKATFMEKWPSLPGLSSGTILDTALHSAGTWELTHLRATLLTTIIDGTSILDDTNYQSWYSSPKLQPPPSIDENRLRQVISVYEFTLFAPTEYLTRATRQSLVQRAMAADVILCQRPDLLDGSAPRALAILREFLKRYISFQGSLDHEIALQFLKHVMCSLAPSSQVTLDLLEVQLSSLFRSKEKSAIEGISSVFSFLSAPAFSQTTAGVDSALALRMSSVHLIGVLTRDFSVTEFSDDIVSSMKSLHRVLLAAIQPQMVLLESGKGSTGDISQQCDTLRVWCKTIAFGRWLQLDQVVPLFGTNLTTMFLSSTTSRLPQPHLEEICSTLIALLLEENCLRKQQPLYSDILVAAYVRVSKILTPDGLDKIDSMVAKGCKLFTVTEFSYILELCSEFIANEAPNLDATTIVHLSAVLLHDAPPSTLKTVQSTTMKYLHIFTNTPAFYSGPLSLRHEVIHLVSQHCSDRPAALRSSDLGSIWSLLARYLAGSEAHDGHTSYPIFHTIVGIISSLVRFRRDLVVHTLPHLGAILRQLIASIRQLRPQLGGKQKKVVTDTMPIWLNAAEPLQADEVKALARLLTGITSKSIVRTHHGPASDNQKAESLATPFSKHAAYVLKAYIDSMNDPLCVLPLELRRELQPGLFSLCDMITEHSRDAMMVSALDAGGKATMKTLWKEYEKQRYVGKG